MSENFWKVCLENLEKSGTNIPAKFEQPLKHSILRSTVVDNFWRKITLFFAHYKELIFESVFGSSIWQLIMQGNMFYKQYSWNKNIFNWSPLFERMFFIEAQHVVMIENIRCICCWFLKIYYISVTQKQCFYTVCCYRNVKKNSRDNC